MSNGGIKVDDRLRTTKAGVYAAGEVTGRDQVVYLAAYGAEIVKVTGTLFHTQGGLVVDAKGRVLMEGGTALPNLFAAGGAARGVSGPKGWGYLSGNGLLTAFALGRIAAREAARTVSS